MDFSNIITAIITGGVTLLGVIITNSKTMAIIQNDIKHLTEKVEKHNTVIERVYNLETKTDVMDEKIKVANKRILDLEGKGERI